MSQELRHIVHVDDEQDIRELVELSLVSIGGFQVTSYESGLDMLDDAEALNADLILLDVMMPGIDGEETFKRLKSIDAVSKIPVVFLTARASADDQTHLMALGADAVLTKPFDPMELPKELQSVWAASR